MPITKLQRWLDLIAYLVTRRLPASFEEIAAHVPAYARADSENPRDREAVRRMFERDKDELRAMGIPIETVAYSLTFGGDAMEGYVINTRDFYLPYLRLVREQPRPVPAPDRHRPATVELHEKDVPVVLEALRRMASLPHSPLAQEARSAFRKLAFDLDPDAFGEDSPVLFVDRPGQAELAERLRTLTDALLARKRVHFRYHGIYRGEETERDVRPYGMLFQDGHWYLIGYDEDRSDLRVFRVGRIERVRVNTRSPHTPDYEIPGDFELASYTGRRAWELGDPDEGPLHVDVLFRFPLSLWAERNGHGRLVRELEGGSTIRRFEVLQVSAFLRWLLGLGPEAELLEPPELEAQRRELAREIARQHGGRHA